MAPNDDYDVPASPSSFSFEEDMLLIVAPKLASESYSFILFSSLIGFRFCREKLVSMTLLEDLSGLTNISPLVLRPMLK